MILTYVEIARRVYNENTTGNTSNYSRPVGKNFLKLSRCRRDAIVHGFTIYALDRALSSATSSEPAL